MGVTVLANRTGGCGEGGGVESVDGVSVKGPYFIWQLSYVTSAAGKGGRVRRLR
jgi:hypothetical protein